MLGVEIKDNESVERAINRFKKDGDTFSYS